MNNMKRLIAVMMVLTLALCFVACTQPQENPSTTTKPKPAPSSSSSSSTVPSSSTEPENQPTHLVTVLDQDGAPVANATVQLCDDSMCYTAETNEAGVAEFTLKKTNGIAMTKVIDAEGYTYSSEYTNFEDGQTTITLTVTKEAA